MSAKIWIVILCLLIGIHLYKKTRQKPRLDQAELNNIIDKFKLQMVQEMRMISFDNQMNAGADIVLTLISKELDQPLKQNHYLPAKDGGQIPFFVPGIMSVECCGNKISFDIADAHTNYNVVIAVDGSLGCAIINA